MEEFNDKVFERFLWRFDNGNDEQWKDFKSNQELKDSLDSCNYEVKLKSIPFDIDRAKNGDAVEVLPVLNGNWQTLGKCFDKIELHNSYVVVTDTKNREFGQFNLDRIRMKY